MGTVYISVFARHHPPLSWFLGFGMSRSKALGRGQSYLLCCFIYLWWALKDDLAHQNFLSVIAWINSFWNPCKYIGSRQSCCMFQQQQAKAFILSTFLKWFMGPRMQNGGLICESGLLVIKCSNIYGIEEVLSLLHLACLMPIQDHKRKWMALLFWQFRMLPNQTSFISPPSTYFPPLYLVSLGSSGGRWWW